MNASPRSRSFPAPTLRPRAANNMLHRAAASVLRGFATGSSPQRVAKQLYGADQDLDQLLTRAVSTQASTTTPAWAGVLAHDLVSDLLQQLTVLSAAASVIARGVRINFDRAAIVRIPGRTYDPATAAAWVAEGAPIPTRQPPLAAGPMLQPTKMACITTFTAEMAESSNIEAFTRLALTEAAAAALDTQMFNLDGADPNGPPPILATATVVPPTASTDNVVLSDVGGLIQALADHGAGTDPILISAPAQFPTAKFWSPYPVFASLALAPGTLAAIEASSFVSGFDPEPTFSVNTGATLHQESATPADDLLTSSPVQSLFQTDLIGLKMILRGAWALRNPAHAAVVEGVNW